MKADRAQVRADAAKAYRYTIRGLKAEDIAQIENWKIRRVYWLIQEGGRILGGELKLLTEAGLLRALFLHHQERRKELWLLYAAARSVKDKVLCLTRLAEEDARVLELAERMGIIEEKSEAAQGKDGINVNVQTYVTQLLRLPTDALATYLERERAHLFGGERGAAATNGH